MNTATNPTFVQGQLIQHTEVTVKVAGGGKLCEEAFAHFRIEIEARNLALSPGETYEAFVHPEDLADFLESMQGPYADPHTIRPLDGNSFQFRGFRVTASRDQTPGEWLFSAKVVDRVEAMLSKWGM